MKNFIFLLVATMLVLLLLLGYSTSVNSELSQNIVRLHVIANSDSPKDQELKLKIRDAILSRTQSDFTKKSDVEKQIETYQTIAEEVVHENGYDYPVSVEYGNFRFPTKHYDNISLPAGTYDALRVKIGDARGKNWWCVMFPPLCFVDGTTNSAFAEEKLKSMIDKESYDVITSGKTDSFPFEIKFKIVELCGMLGGRDKVYKSAGKD